MTSSATPEAVADLPTALAATKNLAARLAKSAAAADLDGRLSVDEVTELRSSGLLGLMVPPQLGGFGASFLDYTEIAIALAKGSGAASLIFNMHASVTGALAQTPDELTRNLGAPDWYFERRDEILREAANGALYAVAMSERGVGARLSAMSTTYRREGDGFQIKGSKSFVSGATHADAYLVAARSETDASIVSYFLVPKGEGVTVEITWDSLGMRATGSDDLHLDVRVADRAMLGGIEGIGLALAELMPQWLIASYAAVYVGIAQACIEAATEHVRAHSLEHLPAIRARIGRADAQVAAARLAVAEAARRVDEDPGEPDTNHWIWRAKLLAGETAMEVAASMLEAAGSSAMRRGHPLERLYRDARCGSLQPATSDVCADWLGLATLGLDPNHGIDVPRW